MMPQTRKPSYVDFNKKAYAWKPDVNYQAEPERYRVGRGEQGVLICEPYKSELVALWRFKTPCEARQSSNALYKKFSAYVTTGNFVGADMARKFLQMGFTRARRYANYKGGKKYEGKDHTQLERGTGDPEKAISAEIFYKKWKQAEANKRYAKQKADWKKNYG